VALAVGGMAQLPSAHCPQRMDFGPTIAARQTHLCPSYFGLHTAMFSGSDSLFFCSEYYQLLIATQLAYPGGM